MLTKSESKRILDAVLNASDADETEVFLGGGKFALTRFAREGIHQNVAEDGTTLSVRVVLGKRTARVSTTRTDPEGIQAAVEQAKAAARLSREDPGMLPLADPADGRDVDAFDQATADLSPEARASKVAAAIAPSEKAGLWTAGYFSNNTGNMGSWGEPGIFAIANSKGLFSYYRATEAGFSLTSFAGDSSGWVLASARKAAEIPVAMLGERAAEKAQRCQDPKGIEPGRYTVILEPAAVGDLCYFLSEGFNGLQVDEGRSFLSGKVGEKIFGENIDLWDDPYHPLVLGRPFDGEGVPTKRVPLVEKGVVKNLVYDRRTAVRLGAEPTGHGLPVPNIQGAHPSSLVLGGGETPVDEMVKATKEGILVTRLWYNRLVDPKKLIVTGMTRDGTFWVKDGKISHGIKNLRFNQSLIHFLCNVEAISAQERQWGFAVPGILAKDFNFTSVTLF